MSKVRVRIIDSIAGLADPKPKSVLDEKYKKFADGLRGKEKPPSEGTIRMLIDEKKKADRYGDPPMGFAKDWAFKPNDEPMVDEDLARKWEESGICVVIADKRDSKKE